MGALTIAGAAAAAGLVYLISRENEWDAANKRVSSSVSDLTAATAAWNDIQAKGNLLQRAAALDALDAAYAKVTKSEQKQASAAQDAINTFGHSSEFLAKYVGQVETQSAAYRGQNPLLAHNLDLIGQLAVKIGKIPDKANIALLINNKNPTAALDEVLSGFSNIIAGIEQIDTKIANTFKGGIAAAKFKAFFQSVVDQITKVTAMAAAAGAKAQQNATDKTVAKLEAQLAQLTSTGNAALAVQAQDLAQQEQQGREQIAAAVQSAQQNFASIGNTIAQSISAIIDKPFETELLAITIAQDRITQKYDRLTAQLIPQANRLAAENAQAQLASDKLNLQNLRAEVILPGGKGLSSDPKKALEELRKLAAGANVLSKGAIQQFILEYSAALRAVKGDKLGIKQTSLQTARSAKETGLQLRSDDVKVAQDHADKVKAAVIQRIGDLTDAFNQGKLTWAKLSDDLASILGKNNVGFKRAGKLLGSAFEDAFKAQFTGLDLQAQAIAAGPHTPGAGLLPQIVKPEEVVKQTLLQNARSADALSKAQIAQQKATNALLTKIHNAQKGTKFTSSLDKNPGKQSKESGALAGTTG